MVNPLQPLSCPIAATLVWTQERQRSRAVRPPKHNPAKPDCFLTQRPLNPEANRPNVMEETPHTCSTSRCPHTCGHVVYFNFQMYFPYLCKSEDSPCHNSCSQTPMGISTLCVAVSEFPNDNRLLVEIKGFPKNFVN